jgi:hypothetical protein
VIEPFVEGSLIQVNKVGEGIFNTRDYYTKDRIWSLSVGMRVGLGMMGHRMGRYGLLVQPMGPRHEEHMHDQ